MVIAWNISYETSSIDRNEPKATPFCNHPIVAEAGVTKLTGTAFGSLDAEPEETTPESK